MVRASMITKCKRKAPTQTPYGSGYITESHGYGRPDIFKTVIYHPISPETPQVTAYYIDYPSLQDHRLHETVRPKFGLWRFQELIFKIYTNVDDEYEVIFEVTADGDESVDDLAYRIIAQIHDWDEIDETQNTLPRREGYSFDLQHRGASLFQKINVENRNFGQRIQVGDIFRYEPRNVYELLWKEYDAQGRECSNTFYGGKLYPVMNLTSESDEEDGGYETGNGEYGGDGDGDDSETETGGDEEGYEGEYEAEGEEEGEKDDGDDGCEVDDELGTNSPPQTPRLSIPSDGFFSLLLSSPEPSDISRNPRTEKRNKIKWPC
ncbi:hypothetical protein TWF718_001044 [Orbilia javanica]|uniref:Uncharacterized protein n=1 Tax=Orbilia javanica TaxID=47235 RepID=A0AAN8N894_9PEZI